MMRSLFLLDNELDLAIIELDSAIEIRKVLVLTPYTNISDLYNLKFADEFHVSISCACFVGGGKCLEKPQSQSHK